MAGRTAAQTAALEKKALAAGSKSEGMRLLFENGYTVAEAAAAFDVKYGFAYGVARRGGYVEQAAERRAPAKAKPAAKAPAKAKAAAKPTAKAAPKAATKRTAPARKAKA